MMSTTNLLILIELAVLAVEVVVIFLLLTHLRGMDHHNATLEDHIDKLDAHITKMDQHIMELERHQIHTEENIGRLANRVGIPDTDVPGIENED